MLNLSNKEFKEVIIKILRQRIIDALEVRKQEILSQEIENIKKSQMEILELRNVT